MKTIKFIFVIISALVISCSNADTQKTNIVDDSLLNEFQEIINESEAYLQNRDIDGDKISDDIIFDYSGGAHCCYKMSIYLSSKDSTYSYPFQMDGGYEFGIVDGSQPQQFRVDDLDRDGLPEIFMVISTYNGEVYEIEEEWTMTYGFKTNYIVFDYYKGDIVIKEYKI